MKCFKCGYLGYERTERCRNCGYEFSLRTAAATPELRLRGDDVPAPLDDLALLDHATPAPAARRFADAVPEVDAGPRAGAHNGVVELPLFGSPITDDVPLITRPSPPRPPLAVRRATPEVPRLRIDVRTPLLELPVEPAPAEPSAPDEDTPPAVPPLRGAARRAGAVAPMRATTGRRPEAAGSSDLVPAALATRAAAAAIDLALLAAVDVAVVYLTLEMCGVAFSELAIVPKVPLIAFLLVQNGGYLVAFTVVGQTLGKLLTGLRVLADDRDESPGLTRAALRAFMWMLLALPAGLGFVPTALSRDGRGLHDRFAGTRVVRANA